MPDENPGIRPAGSGMDGQYVHERKPTIDDVDDVDDEDGILQGERDKAPNDIEPRAESVSDLGEDTEEASLGEEPTRTDSLRREDKGAVNLDPSDME
jgi:hypothetical protein